MPLDGQGPGYTWPVIISASRRCDLPAFGLEAFLADLEAGFRLVPNPWDASRPRRVELGREAVDGIVFWTRDPRPLLAQLGRIQDRACPFYVQLTITGYPRSLEPGGLGPEEACEAAQALAAMIGPQSVLWRYDPIVLAESGLDPDFHRENFARLARRLAGATRSVTLSLLDEYRFTGSRLARAGFRDVVYGSPRIAPPSPSQEGRKESLGSLPAGPWPSLLADLARLAREAGLVARACAEPWDLSGLGIGRASCVDPGLLERLGGRLAGQVQSGPGGKGQDKARDRGQRKACGCAPSVDVGSYGPCPRACAYCYARR